MAGLLFNRSILYIYAMSEKSQRHNYLYSLALQAAEYLSTIPEVKRVLICGSVAEDRVHEKSDCDLAVIGDNLNRVIITKRLNEINPLLEAHFCTSEDIRLERSMAYVAIGKMKGIEIYTRSGNGAPG